MTVLALGLAAILLALSALHAYWGLGGFWPGHDADSCASIVAGSRHVTAMPNSTACFAVAGALTVSALTAVALGGIIDLGAWRILAGIAGIGVMLVFLGRGIAGYLPAWRRKWPRQPFASLDVRYYSPLCLSIGAGFSALLLRGF